MLQEKVVLPHEARKTVALISVDTRPLPVRPAVDPTRYCLGRRGTWGGSQIFFFF